MRIFRSQCRLSMRLTEDRFNKKFKYPYTFLNEEPFSDEFKECVDSTSYIISF